MWGGAVEAVLDDVAVHWWGKGVGEGEAFGNGVARCGGGHVGPFAIEFGDEDAVGVAGCDAFAEEVADREVVTRQGNF